MKKIIDYKILLNGDKDLIAFQDEVRREIKIGWQPLGAPFEYGQDLSCIAQAMVKYSE